MADSYNDNDPSIVTNDCLTNRFVAKSFLVDSFIRNLLRHHFASDPLEKFPGVRSLVWEPDERAGGDDRAGTIRIDLAEAWNPSRVDSMPAILVSAGDLASSRLGIADTHQPLDNNLEGRKTMTRAWAGSVLIFALARKPRQSRLIGAASAEFIQSYSQVIRKELGLAATALSSLKSTRPLREQPEILATPVIFEYGFIETWHVYPEASPINHFTVNQ